MSETFRLTISENLLSPSVASVAPLSYVIMNGTLKIRPSGNISQCPLLTLFFWGEGVIMIHYERHIKDTKQIPVQCF